MDALPRSPAFLAIVAIFVLAEAAWRLLRLRQGYDARAAAGSLGVAAVNILLKPLTGAVTAAVFLAIHEATPLRLPFDDWRAWAIAFVGVEFAYYWLHRWSHTVRWLWASHAVHHTAQELTLPAAVRLGWTSLISGAWLVFAPLVALGIDPVMVASLLGANLVYQFFLHTEVVGRLGPLEWVLNTPTHHRVHHASNPPYIDRNYGGVVIVFDRLFGTFAAEQPGEPLRYGLVHQVTSNNPLVIALHEWRRMLGDVAAARSPRALASALVGRPR